MILLSRDIMYTSLHCYALHCNAVSNHLFSPRAFMILFLVWIWFMQLLLLTYQKKKKKAVAILFAAFFIDAVIVLFSTGSWWLVMGSRNGILFTRWKLFLWCFIYYLHSSASSEDKVDDVTFIYPQELLIKKNISSRVGWNI